jgi:hypothetical protein
VSRLSPQSRRQTSPVPRPPPLARLTRNARDPPVRGRAAPPLRAAAPRRPRPRRAPPARRNRPRSSIRRPRERDRHYPATALHRRGPAGAGFHACATAHGRRLPAVRRTAACGAGVVPSLWRRRTHAAGCVSRLAGSDRCAGSRGGSVARCAGRGPRVARGVRRHPARHDHDGDHRSRRDRTNPHADTNTDGHHAGHGAAGQRSPRQHGSGREHPRHARSGCLHNPDPRSHNELPRRREHAQSEPQRRRPDPAGPTARTARPAPKRQMSSAG